MAQDFSVVTASYANLQITSTLNNFPSEKRFQKDMTIGTLKVNRTNEENKNPNVEFFLVTMDGKSMR